MPRGLGIAAVAVVALVAASIVHTIVFAVIKRIVRDVKLVRYTRTPVLLLLAIVLGKLLFAMAFERSFLGPAAEAITVGIILSVTWLVIGLIAGADDLILRKYRTDVRDNLAARRMHT
ncbi:MAG: hypothetical protein AAF747_05445, partial [Planctomycetota bacterium]